MKITEERIDKIFEKKKLNKEDTKFAKDYAEMIGYTNKEKIKLSIEESNELSQAIRSILGYKIDDVVMDTPLTTVETVGILDTARWKLLHAVTNASMGELLHQMENIPEGIEVVDGTPQPQNYIG